MENYKIKYFLGANSCEGFVSTFGSCYDPDGGWRAYIIKGGPGTGKSSFMKFLVTKAIDKNIKTELFPCSSDPHSLDAVIFPERKVVVMDGTAPHTVDPVFPGVCEQILNFGEYWNESAFEGKTDEILKLTKHNKALHKTVSRYMHAVGQLMTDSFKIAESCTDKLKTTAYAQSLSKKYIPKKKGKGKEWVRFLCGITPIGVVSYAETVISSTNNTVAIKDDTGSVSNIIMNTVREYALNNGYEIINIKNAFLPSLICDHIIIPELSLSFVREYGFQHFSTPVRRVHARRFMSLKQLNLSREKLRFNSKAVKHLLLSASAVLSEAKSVHDDLEKHYISAMDFNKLTQFANEFSKHLFGE